MGLPRSVPDRHGRQVAERQVYTLQGSSSFQNQVSASVESPPMPRHNTVRNRRRSAIAPRAHLCVESLESRLVPYSVSGNAWPNPQLVTLSFVPDGTNVGAASNLFATFNAKWSTATWEAQILRAAQIWAQQANINFAVVSDNGAAIGSGSYQQGDPAMGDIRIGGYNLGSNTLASGYLPPPANDYSVAGDIQFNTGQAFNIGSTYDIFTVAAHEFGHALGLYHSSSTTAIMYGAYTTSKRALITDDIAGIQAIYGARKADAYDAGSGDNSFATAADITSQISSTSLTALANNLDITTTSDVDYYMFTAPTATNGTLSVQVQSSGLSLLSPTLTVYAADQTTVLASVNGAGQYGTTLSATINGITAGQRFYVKVAGADCSAFGTGAYALGLSFGPNAAPRATSPNTQSLNGATPQSQGGLPNDTLIPNNVATNTTFNTVGALTSLNLSIVLSPSSGDSDNHDGYGPEIAPPLPAVSAAANSNRPAAAIPNAVVLGTLDFAKASSPTAMTGPAAATGPTFVTLAVTPAFQTQSASRNVGLSAGAEDVQAPSGGMKDAQPAAPVQDVAPAMESTVPNSSTPESNVPAGSTLTDESAGQAVAIIASDLVLVPPVARLENPTLAVAVEGEESGWLAATGVGVLLGAAGLVPLNEDRLRWAARAAGPRASERRRATRYPCWLRGACRPFGGSLLERRASIVRDLSTGGVNLMLDKPVDKGTALAVELEGDRRRPCRYLLAHVAHLIEDSEGQWLVGCAFDRSLSEQEVRALLLSCVSPSASLDFPLWPSGIVGRSLE